MQPPCPVREKPPEPAKSRHHYARPAFAGQKRERRQTPGKTTILAAFMKPVPENAHAIQAGKPVTPLPYPAGKQPATSHTVTITETLSGRNRDRLCKRLPGSLFPGKEGNGLTSAPANEKAGWLHRKTVPAPSPPDKSKAPPFSGRQGKQAIRDGLPGGETGAAHARHAFALDKAAFGKGKKQTSPGSRTSVTDGWRPVFPHFPVFCPHHPETGNFRENRQTGQSGELPAASGFFVHPVSGFSSKPARLLTAGALPGRQ